MKQLRWKDFSLVSKIVIEVGMIAVLLFAMNMLFYVRINNSMQKMDNVYASNAELTELSQVFEKVQDNMYKYLKVKNSQTLLDYYQNEAKYRNELEKLNEDNINDPVKLLERNIRKMSETYLDCTAETVAAKRGRNVEQYKRKYDDATKLYRYIQSSIDELNNLMFQENSSTYAVLRAVMRYLEISNSVIMIIIVAGGMLLLIQATRNMFVPLSNMAETAQLVGQGNFHVKMHDTDAQDELGTVTRAFNTMVENLDLYMARTKASMEKEQQMMERELLMENHLKEAQLKYLQSQINPHFLFNSLNAGAQLAMMEDAEQTGIFVEKMADFFRYNVKKGQEDATLGEELEAVDNYIYILNVRFAGDIHFSKEVDESLENVRMPSMILQYNNRSPDPFTVDLSSIYSLIDTHSSGLFAKIPETIMNTVPPCKHSTVCGKTVIILADFVQICQLFAILIIVFFSTVGFPSGESTADRCCLDICKIYSR